MEGYKYHRKAPSEHEEKNRAFLNYFVQEQEELRYGELEAKLAQQQQPQQPQEQQKQQQQQQQPQQQQQQQHHQPQPQPQEQRQEDELQKYNHDDSKAENDLFHFLEGTWGGMGQDDAHNNNNGFPGRHRHRHQHRRGLSVHDKLPMLMKHMSSRKLTSALQHHDDEEPINNGNDNNYNESVGRVQIENNNNNAANNNNMSILGDVPVFSDEKQQGGGRRGRGDAGAGAGAGAEAKARAGAEGQKHQNLLTPSSLRTVSEDKRMNNDTMPPGETTTTAAAAASLSQRGLGGKQNSYPHHRHHPQPGSSSPQQTGNSRLGGHERRRHQRKLSSMERVFDFSDQLLLATSTTAQREADHTTTAQVPSSLLHDIPQPDDANHYFKDPNTLYDIETAFNQDQENTNDVPPDVSTPLLGNTTNNNNQRTINTTKSTISSTLRRAGRILRHMTSFVSVFGPTDILNNLWDFCIWTIPVLIVPLLLTSTILFYCFDNPSIGFFDPYFQASLSWGLLFAVRQLITFHLAQTTEYFLYVIIHRTTLFLRIFGPLVTLLLMQSTGWPLVVTSWSIWNFILLWGKHPFFHHWLFFTNLAIFNSKTNPDGGILESDFYVRILFSMIIVGVAVTAKRTTVALYLGSRMLQHYRPQLEETLHEMELIAEVAELSAETEREGFETVLHDSSELASLRHSKLTILQNTPKFKETENTNFSYDDDEDDDDNKKEDEENNTISFRPNVTDNNPSSSLSSPKNGYQENTSSNKDQKSQHHHPKKSLSSLSSATSNNSNSHKEQWSRLKTKLQQQRQDPLETHNNDNDLPIENLASPDVYTRLKQVREAYHRRTSDHSPHTHHHYNFSSSWTTRKTMSQLEPWQEPEDTTAQSKKANPSIYDVLQFRKASSFMNNAYPFSAAFGSAHTRKACVKSSIKVYNRLLKFVPDEDGDTTSTTNNENKSSSKSKSSSRCTILPFDVIGALAYDACGELDENRGRLLLRLFVPDKDDNLSEIAFVQSIDSVYKKLRCLRASLSNSTKIDSVLEDMFTICFYLVMVIIITSVLGWNPWPLLVSFSTLMVSFAFAFGPSAAKYIEGILLIAIRRPFDIGDRISISQPEQNIDLTTTAEQTRNWFVQDITLTTTTLRLASTNEVCTINNYSIANSRIVNFARSPKALVTIFIKFALSWDASDSDYINHKSLNSKIDLFRSKIDVYLKDRPRSWGTNGLIHFRSNSVSFENKYVEYILQAQHVKSWQEHPYVMVQKSELQRKCVEVAKKLGIEYTTPPACLNVDISNNPPPSSLPLTNDTPQM